MSNVIYVLYNITDPNKKTYPHKVGKHTGSIKKLTKRYRPSWSILLKDPYREYVFFASPVHLLFLSLILIGIVGKIKDNVVWYIVVLSYISIE